MHIIGRETQSPMLIEEKENSPAKTGYIRGGRKAVHPLIGGFIKKSDIGGGKEKERRGHAAVPQ